MHTLALGPAPLRLWVCILGKPLVPMLQLASYSIILLLYYNYVTSGVSTVGPSRTWALPSMSSSLPIIVDFSQAKQLAFGKSLKTDRYTVIEYI